MPTLSDAHGPLFYLAGPLAGGGDWQSLMVAALQRARPATRLPAFQVAIPYKDEHRPAAPHALFAPYAVLAATEHTDSQLPWERRFMELAAGVRPRDCRDAPPQRGCLLFWMPAESAAHPKPPAQGPYAQDTRGELGEWRGRLMHDGGLRVVVGCDPHFPGCDTLTRNFKAALGEGFTVHSSLEATAAAAAGLLFPSPRHQLYGASRAALDAHEVAGRGVVRAVCLCAAGHWPNSPITAAGTYVVVFTRDIEVAPELTCEDAFKDGGLAGYDCG